MSTIAAFLRANWRWLALAFGVIFGTLVLVQGAQYGLALYSKHQLASQLARAEQQLAEQHAQATARYHRYQLDSTERAGQRRVLFDEITLLEQQDAAIDSLRPPRPLLPVLPPRL